MVIKDNPIKPTCDNIPCPDDCECSNKISNAHAPKTSYLCSFRGSGIDQNSCHNKLGFDIGRCSHMIEQKKCWRGITEWESP